MSNHQFETVSLEGTENKLAVNPELTKSPIDQADDAAAEQIGKKVKKVVGNKAEKAE
jgi:hypothetical protein